MNNFFFILLINKLQFTLKLHLQDNFSTGMLCISIVTKNVLYCLIILFLLEYRVGGSNATLTSSLSAAAS